MHSVGPVVVPPAAGHLFWQQIATKYIHALGCCLELQMTYMYTCNNDCS